MLLRLLVALELVLHVNLYAQHPTFASFPSDGHHPNTVFSLCLAKSSDKAFHHNNQDRKMAIWSEARAKKMEWIFPRFGTLDNDVFFILIYLSLVTCMLSVLVSYFHLFSTTSYKQKHKQKKTTNMPAQANSRRMKLAHPIFLTHSFCHSRFLHYLSLYIPPGGESPKGGDNMLAQNFIYSTLYYSDNAC